MASGKVTPVIRRATITGTTNSNGTWFPGPINTNSVILGIYNASENYAFVPYNSITYGNGVIVFNDTMSNKIANTSVTATFVYVET